MALAKGRQVHFLPTYRAEHRIKLSELLGYMPTAQQSSIPFIRAVVNLRNYKTDEELVEIEGQ